MSSLVDVPVQLALAILLATGSTGDGEAAAGPTAVARQAHAGSSIAADFTEESWLAAVREHGAAAGLRAASQRIFRTSTGRLYVPVAADRQAILALRRDADLARRLAAAVARADAVRLEVMLGRPATGSEVMLAHLVGAKEASALAIAASREPRRPAAEVAPVAALGHPDLFFADTRPRSAAAVVALVTVAFERAVHLAHSAPEGHAGETSSGALRGMSTRAAAAWRTAVTPSAALR